MNLSEFLTNTAKRIPDHPAIRFAGKTVTFGEMNRRVDALALGLTRLGINPGDVCLPGRNGGVRMLLDVKDLNT